MKDILDEILRKMQEADVEKNSESAHTHADYLLHDLIENLMGSYDAQTQDRVKQILKTWESVSRHY